MIRPIHSRPGSSWAGLPALAVLGLLLSGGPSSPAHRLDEYLQAARIEVAVTHVDLELDLTPGLQVLPAIVRCIDLDRDGLLSPAEQEAYADLVRTGLSLSVDGRPRKLGLVSHQFPSAEAMAEGVGMIRLQFRAGLEPLRAAAHRLEFRNGHQTNLSVYLVNALVPADPSLRVTRQKRSEFQREFEMDFTRSASPPAPAP